MTCIVGWVILHGNTLSGKPIIDSLAKFGLSLDSQIRIFNVPPSFICNLLEQMLLIFSFLEVSSLLLVWG